MKVGFGKSDITPRVGVRLVGYRDQHFSTGVHDPLQVGVAALEDDAGTRALLVAFDLLDMSFWAIEPLAAAVTAACGVPRERIVFNCSHTHTGPYVMNETGAPDGGPYLEFLEKQAAAAAREAVAALEPADAVALSVPVSMAINRDVILPNGHYRYFPDYKHLRPLLDGPVDHRPGAMLFRKPGTSVMIGAVVNHNCHPVFLGAMTTEIGADYVGYFRDAMTRTTGAPVVFLQGHCGNTHPPHPESGHSAAQRYGETLAESMLDFGYMAMKRVAPDYAIDHAEIAGRIVEETFDLDSDKLAHHYSFRSTRRRERMEDEHGPVPRLRVALQALAIGPLGICGLPGEMVAQLALHIKWNSPFRHTWMSYLATDHVGYISHRNGLVHGGYVADHHALMPMEGCRMAQRYIELLGALNAS